jgi:hypothetical protein
VENGTNVKNCTFRNMERLPLTRRDDDVSRAYKDAIRD